MKEREVQDRDNITWKCVQAFSGSGGEAAKEAVKITEQNGQVEVICTPSGQAQTVRLSVDRDWFDRLSDAMLLQKIENSRS